MEELTIEQKAKAYDELLIKAKQIYNKENDVLIMHTIEDLFPELKEPEDEMIKQKIIKLIKKSNEVGGYALHKWEADEMLAWLEKQGEQKLTLPIWKYKSDNTPLLRDSLILNKYGCVAKSPSGAIVSSVWVIDYDELAKLPKEEIEKQAEQKPADKVVPKFKVGDTVTVKPMLCHGKVFKGEPFKIVDIIEDNYVSDDGKTYSISLQDGWELIEQKPWSEEDEEVFDEVINNLHNYIFKSDNTYSYIDCDKHIIWLKSLKERYFWKPSDEQMRALDSTAGIVGILTPTGVTLCSLYKDLEKLKGE